MTSATTTAGGGAACPFGVPAVVSPLHPAARSAAMSDVVTSRRRTGRMAGLSVAALSLKKKESKPAPLDVRAPVGSDIILRNILRKPPDDGAASRREALRPGVLRLQVALGLEGGHAAGARGRHGLAIGEVGDVAGREDSGHGGLGRSRHHLHVAVRAELDLALEEGGVRMMADGHEEPVDRRLPDHAALEILEPDGGDLV